MRALRFDRYGPPDVLQWQRLATLAQAGVLCAHVERAITPEDVAEAQRAMETGHGRGKIVVRF